MIDNTYQIQKKAKHENKLKELKAELPDFCKEYIRGIGTTTELSTQIGYLIDIRTFLTYIKDNNPLFSNKTIKEITIDTIGAMTISDLLEFIESVQITNDKQGIKRKQAALRSLYKFLYKTEAIDKNPAELLTTPKIHQKNIIYLESDEVTKLVEFIEKYEEKLLEEKVNETDKDKKKKLELRIRNFKASKDRDIAMIALLLGTGMRVSECIGIDILDIDYDNLSVSITKKGGDQMKVYFNEYVKDKLLNYLEKRNKIKRIPPEHEKALFLSKQKRRISVRMVEKLVKQYTLECFETNKQITPHKLRSTYGTHLYRETGDIFLVCDAMGHKDVNTAKKHYVQGSEQMRKRASENIGYLQAKPHKTT